MILIHWNSQEYRIKFGSKPATGSTDEEFLIAIFFSHKESGTNKKTFTMKEFLSHDTIIFQIKSCPLMHHDWNAFFWYLTLNSI